MIEREDHHLRKSFATLRLEDAAGSPSFQATVAAARARRAGAPVRHTLGLAALR